MKGPGDSTARLPAVPGERVAVVELVQEQREVDSWHRDLARVPATRVAFGV